MKKVLMLASVASIIDQFNMPNIKILKDLSFEVHVAANFHNGNTTSKERLIEFIEHLKSLDIIVYDINLSRNGINIANIRAYKEIKKLIEKEKYQIIHCHSPIGSVIARIASRKKCRNVTNIIYTAHGFHFYKGAPIKNWIFYYPIEKWLSKFTDCLITINDEDYQCAIKKKFKAKKIVHINGVGVDLEKFKKQTAARKAELRKDYGFNDNDFILIYAGELSYRKHQDLLIDTVALLKDNIPNLKLLLAGRGPLKKKYEKQIKRLAINNKIELLGYRSDVSSLMMLSDIAVSSSRQEGLPVNILEAMAVGLPIIATDCRGNRDLVIDGENGFLIDINNKNAFSKAIKTIYKEKDLQDKFGESSLQRIKKYSKEDISKEMETIYKA